MMKVTTNDMFDRMSSKSAQKLYMMQMKSEKSMFELEKKNLFGMRVQFIVELCFKCSYQSAHYVLSFFKYKFRFLETALSRAVCVSHFLRGAKA